MRKRIPAALCGLCFLMSLMPISDAAEKPVLVQKPKKVLVPPTKEQLKLVEAAIPSELPVRPQKPRCLLVFSESFGFKHNSRLIGEEMLKLMAKKTGAFSVTINNNATEYTSEYLKSFDAIVILNATEIQAVFKDERRQDLLNFVRNGGGMIGIHAATDGGKHRWPEYSEMWGGAFGGHPWGAKGTWTVANNDPENAINASFAGKGFDIRDELYRVRDCFKDTFTEGKFRTLCSVDLTVKNNIATPNGKIRLVHSYVRREPGVPKPAPWSLDVSREHPLAWIKPYGKGRVFYTTFGHNEEVYWNPKIVAHYIAGIQYAIGDLKADDVNEKK